MQTTSTQRAPPADPSDAYPDHNRLPVAQSWPPLAQETRDVVPTDCAAHHLNRRPQTLRMWACLENGPVRPIRIQGRLAWKTVDLRRVVGGSQ